MAEIVVIPEETETDETETAADAVETAADAVETAAEVVEAVADSSDDTNGEVIDAVLVTEALSIEQRVTRLEEQSQDYATRTELDYVLETAYRAEDLAIDAIEDAEDATDPAEVESMIEATEVTTDEDGNTVLDAPADVPPPGSGQHILFAPASEVRSRFSKWISGDKS